MISCLKTPGLTNVITIVGGHIALCDIIGFEFATALGFVDQEIIEITIAFELSGAYIGGLVALYTPVNNTYIIQG